jgi:hypothetical protein
MVEGDDEMALIPNQVQLTDIKCVPKPVAESLEKLINQINVDEVMNGGLLSRDTHKIVGNLLLTISEQEKSCG